MRVRITNPVFVHDLVEFLRRAECVVEQTAADTIDVALPHALMDEAARMEVGFYLGVWEAMHPGVGADRIR